MKKGYIYSAIVGGTFFAIPYLALGTELIPALVIGAAAYGAGALITKGTERKIDISTNKQNLYDILKEAKEQTSQINYLSKQLDTLSKKPEKLGQANNFLKYYLPVTIKILTRYDEIENQKLNTPETNKFMKSVQDMMEKIKNAFNEQLNNMYQAEIIDTDAEIKVFEGMLKADGFIDEIDFKIDKK